MNKLLTFVTSVRGPVTFVRSTEKDAATIAVQRLSHDGMVLLYDPKTFEYVCMYIDPLEGIIVQTSSCASMKVGHVRTLLDVLRKWIYA